MSDVAEWDDEGTVVTGAPGQLAQKLPPRRGAAVASREELDVDEAPTPATQAAGDVPQLVFGSVDEFFREKLRYYYARGVGPQGAHRWSARWWEVPEAVSRLDALWRAWEALRLEPTFGMSVWWRDHADHHMRILMDPDGPFKASKDRSDPGGPLPYEPPPQGMFIDVRTLSS